MIKNLVKQSLTNTGILRLAAKVKSPSVAILFYHSVMDHTAPFLSSLGEIVHPTRIFREQIETLAREYNPVTLADVLKFLRDGKDLPPRPVVVTFDDGYTDNYEVAAPILNHFGVPGVFYITVDCIDNSRLPWPARLRFATSTTKKSRLESGSLSLPLENAGQRTEAFNQLSDVCAPMSGEAQEQFVRSVESQLEADSTEIPERLMMTWGEIRKLAAAGHEIGSHTMTHPNIAYVSEGEMQVELAESKRRLEEELSEAMIHFAYPGPALRPNWNERSREISREVGYQTATTIEPGPVRKQDDPLAMKRIGPGASVQALRWNLDCTFLGRKV
jgi:peptidoglycan/xylan/chitin deacetylase (PgdA/CDA1 family)